MNMRRDQEESGKLEVGQVRWALVCEARRCFRCSCEEMPPVSPLLRKPEFRVLFLPLFPDLKVQD
jgi:hypothetical protein